MNPPQQPPLEKLLADKQRIQQACLEQENKINKTFTYIQENAGSLLLSGLSSLLFPAKPDKKGETAQGTVASATPATTSPLGLSDYLSVGKALVPLAWEIIQPLVVSWGIRTIRKKITNLFSPSKKSSEKKK